jgi:hypothetical protein
MACHFLAKTELDDGILAENEANTAMSIIKLPSMPLKTWISRKLMQMIVVEVRVTPVGKRNEVSRHFKDIMDLGFWTCRLGCQRRQVT